MQNDFFITQFKKIDKKFKLILFSSLIWGIIAHGMALFNKYSIHDDIYNLFGTPKLYRLGRWFLDVICNRAMTEFFMTPNFSLPIINGLVSITCIAVSAYIIIQLLDIKYLTTCVAISGIMVTFPMIASLFGYMFTAPYYMIALMLSVIGAFLLCKYHQWYHILTGILLITCAIGIYQAFIPLTLTMFLLSFIKYTEENELSIKRFIYHAIYLIAVSIAFVALYFLILDVFLVYYHVALTNYQNISSAGKEGLEIYIKRIAVAYSYFINPTDLFLQTQLSMFPLRVRTFYYVTLFMLLCMVLYKIGYYITYKRTLKAIELSILFILFPLAENFIFIMCAPETVHQLMAYGQVVHFIFFAWLIEQTLPMLSTCCKLDTVRKLLYCFSINILILICTLYCIYDNAFYLKLNFEQQRAISYFTTLITQIKSTYGYRDEMPVVFLNITSGMDQNLKPIKQLDDINMLPLWKSNSAIHNYAYREFLRIWCGFDPVYEDPNKFVDMSEVKDMPNYPDDGSIKIIDNVIVVKFK